MHIVQYVQYNLYNIVHFIFVYCTNCTYCTYCAKRSNFVHIVHYCTCLYDILYKIVFQYCVQNCTLLHSIIYKIVHCKAPLARCPPAAPAPAHADCFACVASPRPFCRPAPGQLQCTAPPNHWGALYFSESRHLRRAGAAYAGPPPPPAAGGGAPLRKSKGSESTKPSTFFKTRSTSTFSTICRQLERLLRLRFLDGRNSLYHSRSSAQRNDLHRAFAGLFKNTSSVQ